MKSLDRNIWRSSINLQTKIRLYNVYILPILLYGADTWSMPDVASSRRLDAFDQLCLRRIVGDLHKGVARQDEAITSSCFRRRQIFVLCSAIRLTSILINIQVAIENTINFNVSRYYNYKHSNNL